MSDTSVWKFSRLNSDVTLSPDHKKSRASPETLSLLVKHSIV